ncbi:MAG: hypothetical protein PHC33_06625, partial [Candidatus Omnitrophica bacterium]|nr:hypothetical protein [Candidatus Omnitrophota bacterium]
MNKNNIFVCVFIAVMFSAGCTHLTFKNTYKNAFLEPVGETSRTKVSRAAILPFADYSFRQDTVRPPLWGFNRKLIEDLTDEFVKRGILVAVQEDTEGLLVSEGIIKAFNPEELNDTLAGIREGIREECEEEGKISYIAPESELERDNHSEEMLAEVKKMVRTRQIKKTEGISEDEYNLMRIMNILSLSPGEPLVNGVTSSLSKEKI